MPLCGFCHVMAHISPDKSIHNLSTFIDWRSSLTLLHSERPKLYTILAFLGAIKLKTLLTTKKTNYKQIKHLIKHSECNRVKNPIALRNARIVYNFGLSEWNRVKGN